MIYQTDYPYVNGVTTVTPRILIDVPHHKLGTWVLITVCHKNLCSGQETCKIYQVDFPASCMDDGDHGNVPLVEKEQGTSKKINKNISLSGIVTGPVESMNQNLEIFLNPTVGTLFIKSDFKIQGLLSFYDINGKLKTSLKGNEKKRLLLT